MPGAMLEWSVRSLLMALATGVGLAVFRLRVPAMLHRAWSAVLLAMLLLPLWTQLGPSWKVPVLPAPAPVRFEPAPPVFEIPSRAEAPMPAAAAPAPPAPVPQPFRWQSLLIPAYLLGAAFMLARIIAGTLRVRSLLAHARPAASFFTSPQCAAPVTVGWLRPTIVLPESWRTWPAAKLDGVLIHEREHVRRRDPLILWLALLNRAIFWFHPLAWWLERRLTALAEQACDAVVLSRGLDPHDYSRYLVELARSVNQAGARLHPAGAAAFSQGHLAARIRVILAGRSAARTSRFVSACAAALCASMLLAFLACRPSRRPEVRSTMTERRQPDPELVQAARRLSPAAAQQLKAQLEAHPDDSDKLQELVYYYEIQSDEPALDGLLYWFIQNSAGTRAGWGIRPVWDYARIPSAYARGKQLWLARLQQKPQSAFLYMNASEFLEDDDPEQAEQILVEGRRRFPSVALHWEVLLARHYAFVLTGSKGPLRDPHGIAINYSDAPPLDTPYTRKIRATLLASNDVELLTRTVEQLHGSRPNLALAEQLIARALALNPQDRSAHNFNFNLRIYTAELHNRFNPGALSEADRMLLLEGGLGRARLMFADAGATEARARELLSLAARRADDPDSGAGVYLANIALGEVAMSRGDRPAAAKFLLAAADAPPNEYTRYEQPDMSLARQLLDAGDRETVLRYLDRCAAVNALPNPIAGWAAELRQGKNPKLRPVFTPFSRGLIPLHGRLPRSSVRLKQGHS